MTPYFDSLLVKVCTFANEFSDSVRKMDRVLHEFRIRGVKTNIPFLINVIANENLRADKQQQPLLTILQVFSISHAYVTVEQRPCTTYQ